MMFLKIFAFLKVVDEFEQILANLVIILNREDTHVRAPRARVPRECEVFMRVFLCFTTAGQQRKPSRKHSNSNKIWAAYD